MDELTERDCSTEDLFKESVVGVEGWESIKCFNSEKQAMKCTGRINIRLIPNDIKLTSEQ